MKIFLRYDSNLLSQVSVIKIKMDRILSQHLFEENYCLKLFEQNPKKFYGNFVSRTIVTEELKSKVKE